MRTTRKFKTCENLIQSVSSLAITRGLAALLLIAPVSAVGQSRPDCGAAGPATPVPGAVGDSLTAISNQLGIAVSQPSSSRHFLQVDGGARHFSSRQYVNEHGELEVAVELEERHGLFPNTSNVVLYGRDLDRDGRIDGWFYVGADGIIESVDLPSTQPDGWDAAETIIRRKQLHEGRWLAPIVYQGLTAGLTLTEGQGQETWRQILREQIDLRDLEVRVDRIARRSPRDPALLRYNLMIAEAWSDMSKRISENAIRDRFLWAAGDVALYLSGVGIAKGAGFVIERLMPKLLAGPAAEIANRLYLRYFAGLTEQAHRAAVKVEDLLAKSGLARGAALAARTTEELALTQLAIGKRLGVAIHGFEERGRIQGTIVSGGRVALGLAGAGLKEWKYIGLTQFLQLVAELNNRKEIEFSANPIVLGQRISSNRDLVQNLSYMSLETFMQASISSSMTNVQRRMSIIAVVSRVDSAGMNLLVKHEADPKRVALDTFWEVGIGNAQTNLDIASLRTFEAMATRVNNPKLKLLGYAVAVTDQLAGYHFYSVATQKYEKWNKEQAKAAAPKGQMMLIPIFAPN